MKCSSNLYLETTNIKFCFKPSVLSFGVILLSKSNITPRIRQQPPQEPKLINMKNAIFRGLLSDASMVLASRKTYQKLSSNGFDLAELNLKLVDHRQIPIGPVNPPRCQV
jgi:hypothetical protein